MRELGNRMSLSRKNGFPCLAIVVMLLASGCFSLNERTYWEKEFGEASYYGPGHEDLVAKNYQDVKYRDKNGQCMAIGFFPGAGELMDCGKVRCTGIVNADSWGQYIFLTLLGNCFCLCPTWYSLFSAPFQDEDFSGCGLLGCHRWIGTQEYKKRIESDLIEYVITSEKWNIATAGMSFAYSRDGIKAYFKYPGFPVIKSDVEKFGAVDVLHEGGGRIRRFKPAKTVDGYFIFEDRDLSDEEVLREFIKFRDSCEKLRVEAISVRDSINADEGKKRVQCLLVEIDNKLRENLVDDSTTWKLNTDWKRRISETLEELKSRGMRGSKAGKNPTRKEPAKSGNSEFDL